MLRNEAVFGSPLNFGACQLLWRIGPPSALCKHQSQTFKFVLLLNDANDGTLILQLRLSTLLALHHLFPNPELQLV